MTQGCWLTMAALKGMLYHLQATLCVSGDSAYPLRAHLHAPFRNAVLTPQVEAYNLSMSTVRASVEWLFGEIAGSSKCLDF